MIIKLSMLKNYNPISFTSIYKNTPSYLHLTFLGKDTLGYNYQVRDCKNGCLFDYGFLKTTLEVKSC